MPEEYDYEEEREGYEAWNAEVSFKEWLDYQEKLVASYPQDSVQREALANVRKYAAMVVMA